MIFKKNLMNFIIISILFATILISKNWASFRNCTKIKKVYFFGNEFVDNNFLNSFKDEIKNKDIYDLNINELSKVFEDNHYIKAVRVSKHFPDKKGIIFLNASLLFGKIIPFSSINIGSILLITAIGFLSTISIFILSGKCLLTLAALM